MRKFPFYRQPDSMDCGPTCLRMIAKHYGRTIRLQTLREKTFIGRDGVSLLGISEAAERIGFRTRAVKISYDALTSAINLPAILHWKQNHFVILLRIKRNKIYIADPGIGIVNYNVAEFRQHWISDITDITEEGIALLLEPTPTFYAESDYENLDDHKIADFNILKYLIPHKKFILQLFVGLSFSSILQLVIPFLARSVMDVGVTTGSITFIYVILLAQLALLVGQSVLSFVRGWLLMYMSSRINISILTDFLIKLMKLPSAFFESKNTGDILQRMNDHRRIESFLTGSSLNTLFSLFNFLIFGYVIASFNITILSVFMAGSVLYCIWVLLFLKNRKQLDFKKFEISAKEQTSTLQLIQGMQEIKLFGCEQFMRWRWERIQATLFRLNIKTLFLEQWQSSGATLINEAKNLTITFLSAKAVIEGQLTIGSMIAVQYIIGQLNGPIEQMVGFVQSYQMARLSMYRLKEINQLEDEEPEGSTLSNEIPILAQRNLLGGYTPIEADISKQLQEAIMNKNRAVISIPPEKDTLYESPDNCNITFQNVSFTYPGAGNEPVLSDFNLTIPIGKTTALVGTSGSGKTSVLKLLLRYYNPEKGEIKVANSVLSSLSPRAWRKNCGAVLQESIIMSDTIAQNIAIGCDQIDKTRIQHAIQIANLHDLIAQLPLGLNTKIGSEGTGLSAGQRQRILIARVIYKDPAYIFLDEATNSLDANNERVIVDNLSNFYQGKTVIVVAHRLSTVKHADRIVVLDKGKIKEIGTHAELISLKASYFNLVKNQLELGE